MKILVTGGAGFIGSNLSVTLMQNKPIAADKIVVIDNLSLGNIAFISELLTSPDFVFYQIDLLDFDNLLNIFTEHKFDLVWHLSANSDIRYGAQHTDWDLKQNTLVTYNLLECMRRTGTKKIIFASTSAIYGLAKIVPTPEDYGPLFPISLYGAGKLASEGLITAFCDNFDMQSWIFRFGNIVGKNGTHGALVDFIKKLCKNPDELEILGNGKQAKPYLHVTDCIDGMIFGFENVNDRVNYFNLACEGATPVDTLADTVIKHMNLTGVRKHYTGGEIGWVGDVSQVRLDHRKLERLGWSSRYTSDESVEKGVEELLLQIKQPK